jgi:hypothetical protein
VTFIVERRPLTPPEGRRPVLRPLRRATVREGREGDWNVSLWVGSQDEARAIARWVNESLRKREAGDSDT